MKKLMILCINLMAGLVVAAMVLLFAGAMIHALAKAGEPQSMWIEQQVGRLANNR